MPEVRICCVKALQQLFRDSEHVAQLEKFTERFTPRIIEIAARDKDADVQIAAIALTTEMSR